MGSYKKRSS